MKMSRAKKAKDFATLIGVGTCLLVTLSACENSKHAEIMSTEDLRAQAHMSADTDAETGTESAQGSIPFDGESVSQEPLSLSDTFAFAPEPPPSPASPRSAEVVSEAGPEVASPAPAPVLPEGYSESPRVHRSPASDYVPDSPPQVFRAARVREFGVSSVDEPETQIARLTPSDFVPDRRLRLRKHDAVIWSR